MVQEKENSRNVFRIRVAGQIVEIRCLSSRIKDRCVKYLCPENSADAASRQEADIVIESEAEHFREQQELVDRTAILEGRTPVKKPEGHLEWLQLHGMLAEKMLDHDVLLMHGSALEVDGSAYIFTAPSGTGKSTHARLWREVLVERVTMINDDKPMLRVETDKDGRTVVYACGSPWDGVHHLSTNAEVPVKAIVRLERAGENHLCQISAGQAYPIIYRQTLRSGDPEAMAKIMMLQQKIIGSVPFYTLECNMEYEAVRVAYEGLTGKSI